jgi:hypothetical protein
MADAPFFSASFARDEAERPAEFSESINTKSNVPFFFLVA